MSNLFIKKYSDETLKSVSNLIFNIENPLHSISLSADFLKNETLSEKAQNEIYKIIKKESSDILNFINEVLNTIKSNRKEKNDISLDEKKYSYKDVESISELVHDIKNPLCSLILSAELLKKGTLNKKNKNEIYSIIQESSENILNFVNEVLNTIRSNKPKEKVDINLEISERLKELGNLLKEKNIKINLNFGENIFIKGFITDIKRVFDNLISNAIKYNKENGKINIKTFKTKKSVSIEIKDTGIGISESDIKHVFDKFYRAKTVKNSNTSGTGMGLYITNKIVKSHNGTIKLTSKLDKYTKFKINLKNHQILIP
ncbi:MAG: HAMP domain-containing histidine kinase [Candidatus Paraimprobicoccus trichonymphae]|uniref:histidine kinase n=1 Tax=Candidatus Paraimprobicoccus trichonymphae TaxID=3033793 RepID=A0AA48I4R6_9FIRM|nr:MAG: HAMP domain-containing histidine kinase [Candidatus Paraimprobicoccus trichonymphae]